MRVYYEGDVEQEQKRDYRAYKLRGKEIYEPKELAVYLGENWEEGVKQFGRGYITKWVEGEYQDQGCRPLSNLRMSLGLLILAPSDWQLVDLNWLRSIPITEDHAARCCPSCTGSRRNLEIG